MELPDELFDFMTNIEDVVKAVYTAKERNQFINHAGMSFKKGGKMGAYQYKVNERIQHCQETTICLAELINSKYRAILIYFYQTLDCKLGSNWATAEAYHKRQITISLRNEIGLKYALGDKSSLNLPFSSFDILIGIEPSLPKTVFENLKTSATIIVSQTVSQYKRMLDSMFGFSHKTMPFAIFNTSVIESFKNDHIQSMPDYTLSPFCDNLIRNICSGYSSVIIESVVYDEKCVYVEVPHFEYCEKLPLNKSPIICSYEQKTGSYDIFFNCVDVNEKKKHAKLLSVSIEAASATEFTSVVDNMTGVLLTVPTVESIIINLYKKAYT